MLPVLMMPFTYTGDLEEVRSFATQLSGALNGAITLMLEKNIGRLICAHFAMLSAFHLSDYETTW
jgi:hypothetical protein